MSNNENALSNSYYESFSLIFVIIISRNSWKSMRYDPSLSKLPTNVFISSLDGSKPKALKATFNSLGSIVP